MRDPFPPPKIGREGDPKAHRNVRSCVGLSAAEHNLELIRVDNDALDLLRDKTAPLAEALAAPLLHDLWAARDAYIDIILDRHEINSEWTIHASTLEEFMERGVIKRELKQRFIDTYKNPDKFMCVFVVVPEGANFVFFPYVKD